MHPWHGAQGLDPGQRAVTIVWATVVLVWLACQLLARLDQRRQDPALVRRSFPTRSLGRRLLELLADLTGVPELVRAWRLRHGRARHERHVIDRWLGTDTLFGGLGLAPLLALLLYTTSVAGLASLVQSRWVWCLALGLAPLVLGLGRLAVLGLGRSWHSRRDQVRQRARLSRLLDETVHATELPQRLEPLAGGDWLALAETARDRRLSAESALLARLRCLDRALLDAPSGLDREAVAGLERLACREFLGLPAHGDAAELDALLVPRPIAAAAEAQARLLAARLADPASPSAWRERATPSAYRLLELLSPRLDGPACARLWWMVTAHPHDREQRLRLRERLLAEQHAGPAPEPLLAALFWGLAEPARASGVGPRPPLRESLAGELPAGRVTWYREYLVGGLPEDPAGLDTPAMAALLNRLWQVAPPSERESLTARAVVQWAAQPGRSGPAGLVELVPHLTQRGPRSAAAAAALSGLADGLARYLGDTAQATLEALDEAVAQLDPRVARRPALAVARAWTRLSTERGVDRLSVLLDALLAAPRTSQAHEALLGTLEALALTRSPAAAERLCRAMDELHGEGAPAAVEAPLPSAPGAALVSKWLPVACAAAVSRRGRGEGEAWLTAMLPPEEIHGDEAADETRRLLAAAGCQAALGQIERQARRRVEEGGPGALHDRRITRLLERLAAGHGYRAVTRLGIAAARLPVAALPIAD